MSSDRGKKSHGGGQVALVEGRVRGVERRGASAEGAFCPDLVPIFKRCPDLVFRLNRLEPLYYVASSHFQALSRS